MKLREAWGVREGDGIVYLKKLEAGSETDREFAAMYKRTARDGFWSMDYFDAMLAIYGTWFEKLRIRETMAKRSQIRLVKND